MHVARFSIMWRNELGRSSYSANKPDTSSGDILRSADTKTDAA